MLYSAPVGVTPGFQIYPVTPDRLDDVADLFNSNGATRGCWCMFFLLNRQGYFTGRRGGNEVVFRELTSQGEVPLGLVAYGEEKPVGWVAAGPRSRYTTATAPRSKILKGRDSAEDEDVWLDPCFSSGSGPPGRPHPGVVDGGGGAGRGARRQGGRGFPTGGRTEGQRRRVPRHRAGVRRLWLHRAGQAHRPPRGDAAGPEVVTPTTIARGPQLELAALPDTTRLRTASWIMWDKPSLVPALTAAVASCDEPGVR